MRTQHQWLLILLSFCSRLSFTANMEQPDLINEIVLSTLATRTHHRIVEVVKGQEVDRTNNMCEVKVLKKIQ